MQGSVENLTIGNAAFRNLEVLETFTIQGNVENLTIEHDAFRNCKALETLSIQNNVKNLNLELPILTQKPNLQFGSPTSLLGLIPKNAIQNAKVTFFYCDLGKYTLYLLTNDMKEDSINLSKETLETLSKAEKFLWIDFKILQEMNCNGKNIKLVLDDGLKNKFLEVKSSEGSRYKRKKA